MRGSNGFEIRRRAALCIFVCAMAVVLFGVCGCGEQLTRMEENQVRLQAMVAANAREIATLSSQIHTGAAEINQGIQNVDAKAQGIAADVQTVQNDQRQLHETVVAGHQNLDAKATALQEGQQTLQTGVTNVNEVARRTASDLTTLARQHTQLGETVQANQREVNDRFGVVVSNQGGIQTGIANLSEADQGLARDIASVSVKQDAMTASMQTAAETINDKIAVLDRNQQNHHQANIAAVAAAQAATQESLNGNHEQVAGRLASLAESIRNNREVVTGQMAASLQNQQAIQASVQDLHGKADVLTANLANVSSEQAAAKGTSLANHDAIITAMAGLSDSHQSLRSAIELANDKADRIGSGLAEMASDQKALAEASRANHEILVDRLSNLSKSQTDLHAGINALSSKTDVIAAELTAAAQRQTALQQSVAAGNETAVAHATAVAQNQQNLKAAVDALGIATHQVSTDLTALASAQNSFRQTQQNHNEAMATRSAALAEGQQTLRSQVELLSATTSQTALSMLTLNNGQATFQQTMQAGMNGLTERADQTAAHVKGMVEQNTALSQSMTVQAAALAENQQAMKTNIDRMAGVVDKAYADLTAVSLAQDTLQSTLTNRSDEISGRVARLDNSQKELADSINILTATAGQTALDVMGLATGHAELNRSIKAGNDEVIARTTTLAQNQQTIGGQLDVLTATAGQTAMDVLTMNDNQSRLGQTLQGGLANLDSRTTVLGENQQHMQGSLEILTATAGQTAADVLAVNEGQARLGQTLQSGLTNLDSRTTALGENQQKIQGGLASLDSRMTTAGESQQRMQGSLDALTTLAGQTADDVAAANNRQDAIAKAIQSHDESTAGRITQLGDNQQKTQSGLDAVATTLGQTARDITALNENQARSEQTAQAGREQVAASLAEIARNQQGWIERFDAAQARVQAMADRIATLDQQLGKLQGALQTGVQSTATLLDANGQQRQQFEAKIAQDVQAMIEAIAQLRQVHVQLQEQMSQVQKSTQTQAETLKTTIDQIKQPIPEAKVSDAVKSAQPVVVQTGE
jgi:chromosome segregation ATPase